MTDIGTWLGKQLDEDERFARAASGTLGIVRLWYEAAGLRKAMPGMQMADCLFIARHDPARVLREAAAKRRLLAQAVDMRDTASATEAWFLLDMADKIENTLAEPYADHPEFKPEWRVE